jgi:ribonuclease Z
MWSANVLSQRSSDTEPTLVITFETAKYIFGAGENTSRSFIQNAGRMNKARAVFLGHLGPDRTSGLAGEHLLRVLFKAKFNMAFNFRLPNGPV